MSVPTPATVSGAPAAAPAPLSPAPESRFDRLRRRIGLILGPVLFFAVLFAPLEPTLTPAAHRLAAVVAWAFVFWVSEAVPLAVTALAAPALCTALGVAPAGEAYAPFADPMIFLFIGGFLIAGALQEHRLDRRFAFAILDLPGVGRSPARILAAFGIISAGISLFVTNTATTAMILPIALGVLGAIEGAGAGAGNPAAFRRFGTGVLLMVAYGASAGGCGTPVGTQTNLIGIAQIQKAGLEVTFFSWCRVALPLVAAMLAILTGLMWWNHARTLGRLEGVEGYVRAQRAALGHWTRSQKLCLSVFLLVIAAWITPGILSLGAEWSPHPESWRAGKAWMDVHMKEGVVAILVASLLFLLPGDRGRPLLTWSVSARIDWGALMLLGGGLCLGKLMDSTGLGGAVGSWLMETTGARSSLALLALGTGVSILVSEGTSNTAAATVVVPLVIQAARSAGVDPLLPALGATIGASFGFMLPVSTPPNAIVYGTGRIPLPDMVRGGLLFDAAGFVLIVGGLLLLV